MHDTRQQVDSSMLLGRRMQGHLTIIHCLFVVVFEKSQLLFAMGWRVHLTCL